MPDRTPTNNKFFETFSFLPPLSNDEISKQVAYIVNNGWTPCLEFAEPEQAYVSSENSIRYGPVSSGYQDNRYWTMWKLPMFGCQNGEQVLGEMNHCSLADRKPRVHTGESVWNRGAFIGMADRSNSAFVLSEEGNKACRIVRRLSPDSKWNGDFLLAMEWAMAIYGIT